MDLVYLPDQRQVTVHLAQTMRLLEMSNAELAAEVAQELDANPALQLVKERVCPHCGRRVRALPCPACLAKHSGDGPIVFLSPRLPGSGLTRGADEENDFPEDHIPQTVSLAEHLLRQVACSVDKAEQRIAANILARLDDQGLLADHPAEIAATLRVPVEAVTRVLNLIQRADPPGVAALDLRESLLIQLEVLAEVSAVHPLIRRVLSEEWEQLAKRNYAAIARRLGATLEDVEEVARFIRHNLTPYPARAWQDTGRAANHLARSVFYQPDIAISLNPRPGDPLIVEVFTGLAGVLRIDPVIKAGLAEMVEADKVEWAEYIERAGLLAKCVQQRNNTMLRIAEIIVVEQLAFVLGGDSDLKPLTRSVLAGRLCLHESTVSRAVAHKAAALPSGRIVPLSIFFDRSLAVRDAVQSIIRQEPRLAPFSDTQISELLKPQGYTVARRTVAKYRQMLGILPASLRGREVSA